MPILLATRLVASTSTSCPHSGQFHVSVSGPGLEGVHSQRKARLNVPFMALFSRHCEASRIGTRCSTSCVPYAATSLHHQ